MFPRAFFGVLALALMLTVMLVSPTGAVTQAFDVTFATTYATFADVNGEFVATLDPSQSIHSFASIKSISGLASPDKTAAFDYAEEPIPGSKTNATRFVLTLTEQFGVNTGFNGFFTLRTFGYNDVNPIINCLGASVTQTVVRGGSITNVTQATSAISKLVSVTNVVGSPPPPPPATNWVGNSGNWTTAGNWDHGVPQDSFAANLITTTANKTSTYNQTVNPGVLNAVNVDGTGGSTFTLNQSSSATALAAIDENIGLDGKGVYNQSGGTNTIIDALTLGYNAGSSGTYNKSGGTLDTGFLIVGREGTGTFNQNSGSNKVSFELRLGDLSGSRGTYNLNSGSLSAFDETIGSIGTGIFNHNSGTNTVSDTLVLDNGTYNLNSGSLSAPMEVIGQFDTSTFNHNSGTNTVSNFLSLGNGTYNLNSGNLSAPDENIGDLGTGTFNQKSGTNTVSNALTLGVGLGDVGIYNLKSGTLKAANEIIGNAGTGTFTQTAGAHTITGALDIGRAAGSNGTFKMTSGSLTVGGNMFVGHGLGGASTGSFAQTSGSVSVAGDLSVADHAGTIGTYSMTSGSLKVTGHEFIGNNGQATFTQTSGSNTANFITLAANRPPVFADTYTITSGSVTAPGGFTINGPYTPIGTSPPTTNLISKTGGNFLVNGGVTVNAPVTNIGLVKTTAANVKWNGTFTNYSAYISDSSTQAFAQDLVVTPTGYLVGLTSQDLFIFKENFQNQSQDTTHWNTVNAGMKFVTGADTIHDLYVPGVDQGRTPSSSLYSWYSLAISGQTINLIDGNTDNASTALYVGKMLGAIINGSKQVTNIVGGPDAAHPIYIYFDPALNPLLGKNDYAFATGYGALMWDPPAPAGVSRQSVNLEVTTTVPLPPSVYLLGSGLLGLGALGWRRKRLTS